MFLVMGSVGFNACRLSDWMGIIAVMNGHGIDHVRLSDDLYNVCLKQFQAD